jgi:hypothetical protein
MTQNLILAALLTTAVSPAQDTTRFFSKSGDLEIKGIVTGSADWSDPPMVSFDFGGSPLVGKSTEQGLVLNCRSLAGRAELLPGGKMVLRSAVLARGGTVDQVAPDGVKFKVVAPNVTISDSGAVARLLIQGAFTADRDLISEDKTQNLRFAGVGATISMDSLQRTGALTGLKSSGAYTLDQSEKAGSIVKTSHLSGVGLDLNLVDKNWKADFESAFDLKSSEAGDGKSAEMTASADSGSVVMSLMSADEESPVKSANFVGNVDFRYVSKSKASDGQALVSTITAIAETVEYDKANSRIVLKKVKKAEQSRKTGTEAPLGFVIENVEQIDVWLNEDGTIKRVKTNNGSATVKDGK